MKSQEAMNVNKSLLIVFMLCSIFSFSQNKKDVFFICKNDNNEYFIAGKFDEDRDYITVYNREEYEYHQKKVKEAKNKGEYHFDPASGRDNLNMKVSKLTFEIISREKKLLSKCEIKKLNLVDYNWIINNSWKKIAKQPCDFKNIYFLHEIKNGNYESYKVGVTIVAY
ncbi:hypothetical protein [Algibacter lectus]|uniref:hypothetical protein n=1 Tax=Algibacter lectus TaxID=221126 RepID=UPI0026EB641C|nr:hypothetical protein [Algibacter lectus]MDO7138987.1 hypothetical protein [Algibacter lectus]